MTIKVRMYPSANRVGQATNGISQVVINYHKYLPQFGVELVEGDDYDLIAAHAGMTGAACDICHCHGLYWTADYDAPGWEYKTNAKVIEAIRHAKVTTVPSRWVAETFKRDMHYSPPVIPHGIDWQKWEHRNHTHYALYNKNRQGDVCEAHPVSVLATAFPDYTFVSTFTTEALPNIKTTGVLPPTKMKSLVENCGIYIATTKETFGIGILEAMASGVPILGYAHGGILDLVQHGVNGYLAQPGNEEDLIQGFAYCRAHTVRLGLNSRELVKQFTWERACQQLVQVYEQVLTPEVPTASIVIPAYNYGGFVGGAIQSAINQTYPLLENIIVVDDGSQDDTRDVVAQYMKDDPRVYYHYQENAGVAYARNNGISLANTTYVACLDADDRMEPTFLETLIPPLEEDESIGITYGKLRIVNGEGSSYIGKWPQNSDYDLQVKGQNQVPTCCVFRKEMWERLGGYRQRYAPDGCGAEDAEFWLRCGSIGYDAIQVTEEPLHNYYLGGYTQQGNYREVNWLGWHPWAKDFQYPFASVATPENLAHPVRQYDDPLISVIIPVGPGHEQRVIDALDSLEAQTFRQWEAIVVWDTGEPVPGPLQKAFPCVQYIESSAVGTGAARNLGVSQARAPLLLFLDADDELLSTALETMLHTYMTLDDCEAIIYTESLGVAAITEEAADEFKARGELIDFVDGVATLYQTVADYDCELAQKQPFTEGHYFWCYISSLIPKEWHDEIGGFDESLPSWEDWDYWIRLAKAGKPFVAVKQAAMIYNYDLGKRRNLGKELKPELLSKLRAKHEEIQTMGCRSCGSKSIAPPVRRINPYQTVTSEGSLEMNDTDFVQVQYTPNRRGSHSVVGTAVFPTRIADNMRRTRGGWVFYYGYRNENDTFLIHAADQRSQPAWFRLTEQPMVTRKVVRTPQTRTIPTPPSALQRPELRKVVTERVEEKREELEDLEELDEGEVEKEFDLQLIPGVTKAIADEMKARGLDSQQAIMDAGVETLQSIKGVGPSKAEAIVAAITPRELPDETEQTLKELERLLG